jgi:hypothetical protein
MIYYLSEIFGVPDLFEKEALAKQPAATYILCYSAQDPNNFHASTFILE